MANSRKDKLSSLVRGIVTIIIVVVVFALGYLIGLRAGRGGVSADDSSSTLQANPDQKWYCSMDPQIVRDGPGKCPICGMDLVPMPDSADVGSKAAELVVSEEAAKLMELRVSPVERRFPEAEIRMVGKVHYDETRVKNITAWVAGRIDRLYVDFTGITVQKGDHMVYLYSPQLISAQAELLQALKSAEKLNSGASELVTRSTIATLEATREKLRLLGLNAEQIEKIEKSEQSQTHITINSPIGGVVIHKNATEGAYVETGTPIYTVADMSQLWVKLDAYESDLPWIKYGQEVQFTTEANPGEVFKGTISFIDPVLTAETRTVKLRVNIDNSEGKLKPEMLVRAVVRSKVASGGKVMASDMAGKWICPMHPDIIKDSAEKCDICGMDLVTTESLGYVTADVSGEAPLVIPASAPLITGKRAVVYVQIPEQEKPTYQGREVVLGPRAGDVYIVASGLKEGEMVVTNGNFKIDSAVQIQARSSMMNPHGSRVPDEHQGHQH